MIINKLEILILFAILTCAAHGQENYAKLADSLSPIGGHYEVIYRAFEDYPPLRQLQCGLWINAAGDIGFKTVRATEEMGSEDCWLTTFGYYTVNHLKNVVDTATFQMLNPFFFKDKNHIYNYQPLSSGGYIYISDVDYKTFRLIPNEANYALSRDKNQFFNYWYEISDKEVRELENELGIELFTQADCMNFTAQKFDSVTIKYVIKSEEIVINDVVVCPDTIIFSQTKLLNNNEIKQMNKFLISPKSFTHPNMTLYSTFIEIFYYKGDTIAIDFRIDTATRMSSLFNGDRHFKGFITRNFEKYLTLLLQKKKIWTKKDRFYQWD